MSANIYYVWDTNRWMTWCFWLFRQLSVNHYITELQNWVPMTIKKKNYDNHNTNIHVLIWKWKRFANGLVDLDGYSAYTLSLSLTEVSFTSEKSSWLIQHRMLVPMFMHLCVNREDSGGDMLSRVPYMIWTQHNKESCVLTKFPIHYREEERLFTPDLGQEPQ